MRSYIRITVFLIALVLLAGLADAASQIEAIKAQNAQARKENALIGQIYAAENAKNWQEVTAIARQLIVINPDRWEYHKVMADAEFKQGNYLEAIAAYETAIMLAQKDDGKNTTREKALAGIYINEGNAYLRLNRYEEAVRMFTRAAEIGPDSAVAYFNICATMYNFGKFEYAIKECDKAIEADPRKADAFFIKGSILFASGTLDKNNRFIPPPSAIEALKMYLELAPAGSHVSDVKAMLEAAGAKVETTYQKKK